MCILRANVLATHHIITLCNNVMCGNVAKPLDYDYTGTGTNSRPGVLSLSKTLYLLFFLFS